MAAKEVTAVINFAVNKLYPEKIKDIQKLMAEYAKKVGGKYIRAKENPTPKIQLTVEIAISDAKLNVMKKSAISAYLEPKIKSFDKSVTVL